MAAAIIVDSNWFTWCRTASTAWWDYIMQTWDAQPWLQPFHMSKAIFMALALTIQQHDMQIGGGQYQSTRGLLLEAGYCYRAIANQYGVAKQLLVLW